MILRRLSQSLREQNWTAIWIEFVLLVTGVFLGIQVANWNQSRHDAAYAHENLQRIETDLATDTTSLERRVVFWRQVTDYGHGAIRYAETGQLVDGSALKTVLAFYQASQFFHYVPADPSLLPELRFWISNLEVMTDLVSQHCLVARALAKRLQVEFGA